MNGHDSMSLFQQSYSHQVKELSNNLSNIKSSDVEHAIELILAATGKLVLTGMGKSGLIAQKLAATFSSTGTPAFFLHPGESLHGDLGALQKGDVMLLLAKSGESDEVIRMLQVVKRMEIPVISILGNANSSVGRMSDVILPAMVDREADPLNLAPTASTTVSLVVGDSLAAAISEIREFKPENFALFHPAGQLGRRLLLNVEDFLPHDSGVPVVNVNASMKEMLEVESGPNLGAVMVADDAGKLIGIVTDGDLRRAVMKWGNVLDRRIIDLMTANPIKIERGSKAIHALELMENRPSQISVLPVVDMDGRPTGLLRIHDLLKAGL